MKIYPEDYNVAIAVPFVDLNGDPVQPTEVKAKLFDETGALLADFGSLPFDPVAGQKEVVIPAAFNSLGVSSFEEVRTLRAELVTLNGSIRQAHSYLIVGERRLEVMENSFMLIENAEIVARQIANLSGWASATEDQRYAALIEAYNRITRIPMRFNVKRTTGNLDYIQDPLYRTEKIIDRETWSVADAAEFNSWPESFRKTLRAAQLVEANEILEGDEFGKRRRAGVLSETIGESSVSLSSDRLDLGLSPATLKILTGHVYYDFRVAR